MLRLRRRRSLRGRILNAWDRAAGWIVVTIIGLLAAIFAFAIVRSEQWLFDLKEGKCSDGFFKAKRFCCPLSVDSTDPSAKFIDMFSPITVFLNPIHMYKDAPGGGSAPPQLPEEECAAWQTWAQIFDPSDWTPNSRFSWASWMTEYIAYIIVAISLALLSSILTLKFTASTSFIGRKDSSSVTSHTVSAKQPLISGSPTDASQPTTRKVLYFAAGSGIPEIKTILSGFVIHGYLGGRVLFTKSIGLAMSVASGLSLGKEGPFVHIVCCIGNIVSRFFDKYETNEAKRREILSAASAAGVAVAFGAPIGGVLFSLEEVSYFFPPKVMWRSFFCAMIAAVTLKFLNPFGKFSDYSMTLALTSALYQVPERLYFSKSRMIKAGMLGSWFPLPCSVYLVYVPFMLHTCFTLTIHQGVYGAYFSKLNYRWSKHVRNGKWLGNHPKSEVVLITLLTALLSFLNPYTRMGGTELVYNLFAECREGHSHGGLCVIDPDSIRPVVNAIAIALLVKGALTIVTFGIKVPAGIFIPTLGVGACAGRILGLGMQWLSWEKPDLWMFDTCLGKAHCVTPGVYAMVGAAATLSGVTVSTNKEMELQRLIGSRSAPPFLWPSSCLS